MQTREASNWQEPLFLLSSSCLSFRFLLVGHSIENDDQDLTSSLFIQKERLKDKKRK